MPIFRWLHLTDLHLGAPKLKALWTDNILTAFLKDIEGLREQIGGPLDLVCFTGDLVYKGTEEEFAAFDVWLQRLYDRLEALGLGRPYFLAVPGNHDLVRPADAAARALIEGFSNERTLAAQPLVQAAFAPYAAFWDRLEPLRPALRQGLLPGDFATTIDCQGYRIGVVGLNSAALHLTDDKGLKGKLVLGEDQLSEVCDGDVGAWFAKRHAALLLSHHPPDWLRERARFETELAPPGRFVVHLCGHLHEPESRESSAGDGPAQRRWLGRSFFGLDKIRGEVQRRHGYRVGLLRFGGTDEARLYSLPREARARDDGTFGFLQDGRFHFQSGSPLTPERAVTLAAPPPPAAQFQDAGLHYATDADWYIPRGDEALALDLLNQGKSLLVLGPAQYGKSYFIEHIAGKLAAGGACRRVSVDCAALSKSPAELFRDFAFALADDDEHLLEQAAARWAVTALPEKARLRNLLVQDILKPTPGPVLLVLEKADAVLEQAVFLDLFDLLRAIYDKHHQLRLIVAAATSRVAFSFDTSSLRDRLDLIQLADLDRGQVAALAGRYGTFSPAELDVLIAHAAGHPFLLRSCLYKAASLKVSLRSVLADATFAEKLTGQMESWLRDVPEDHKAAVARFAGGDPAPLRRELQDWLWRARFLSDDRKRLRCALYERLFQRIGGARSG